MPNSLAASAPGCCPIGRHLRTGEKECARRMRFGSQCLRQPGQPQKHAAAFF